MRNPTRCDLAKTTADVTDNSLTAMKTISTHFHLAPKTADAKAENSSRTGKHSSPCVLGPATPNILPDPCVSTE